MRWFCLLACLVRVRFSERALDMNVHDGGCCHRVRNRNAARGEGVGDHGLVKGCAISRGENRKIDDHGAALDAEDHNSAGINSTKRCGHVGSEVRFEDFTLWAALWD